MQETPEQGADTDRLGILSAGAEPLWLNPATLKGAISVAAGLFILVLPAASTVLLLVGLSIAIIVSGTTTAVSQMRLARDERDLGEAGVGLAQVFAGVAIIVFRRSALRVAAVIIAGLLAVRGGYTLWKAYRQWRRDEPWGFEVALGIGYVALGATLVLLPESIVAASLIVLAVVTIVIGAVMVTHGLRSHTENEVVVIDSAAASTLIKDWLRHQDVGTDRRADIADTLYFEEPDRTHKLVSWWVMLMLSVAIATFAVIADSTAVVIGAMLVAPLMTPIMGAGAGIVNGWRGRVGASLALVAAGVVAAIALAWLLAAWTPLLVPIANNGNIASRVSPTLIDLMIALAAGAAGAYATVDPRVSSSITGVAIAVALVPPLSVVGIMLYYGMWEDALGAFLLFATNLVSIILASVLVFLLTGFARIRDLIHRRAEVQTVFATVAVAAALILLPLAFTSEGILIEASRQSLAQEETEDWITDTDLKIVRVFAAGADVEVVLSGFGEIPPIEDLEDGISERFGVAATVRLEHVPSVLITYSDATGKNVIGEPGQP